MTRSRFRRILQDAGWTPLKPGSRRWADPIVADASYDDTGALDVQRARDAYAASKVAAVEAWRVKGGQ